MQAISSLPASSRGVDTVATALAAAAYVTRDAGMASTVVLPRSPTTVALAREIGRCLGVPVAAEITADGIEIQFSIQAQSEISPARRGWSAS